MQLYSSPIESQSSFEVTPYFATLLEENDLRYKFQVVFSISQSEIFKKSLNKVVINAINPNVIISEGTNQQESVASSAQTPASDNIGYQELQNILLKNVRQINLARLKLNSIIDSKTVDLQSHINNNVLSDLKAGKDIPNIPSLYSLINSIEENHEANSYPSSDINRYSIQSLNQRLISKFLIDPSEIVTEKKENKNLIIKNLRNFYLSSALSSLQKDEVYYKSVKKVKLVDRVYIKTFLELPKDLSQTNIDIEFEIYEFGNYIPIKRIEKKINVAKHVKLFYIENSLPSLNSSDRFLHLSKVSKSDSFEILQKTMNNAARVTSYRSREQKKFDSNSLQGTATFMIDTVPNNSISIYRCLFKDSSSTVSNPYFKNVIVGNPLQIDSSGLIIEPSSDSNYVTISIVNAPSFADQVQISRRQKVGGEYNDFIVIVPFSYILDSKISFSDKSVKDGQIYEYKIKYKTSDGLVKESISRTYKHVSSSLFSNINTTIQNVVADTYKGKPRLNFNINSTFSPSTSEKLKEYFAGSQAFAALYDSIISESDNYQNLLFNKVTRLNLKTGERETFENLDNNNFANLSANFEDSEKTQRLFSLSPIEQNTSYKYEIRTFLRNPLSVLRDYVKTETVNVGSSGKTKTYSYRPYKWRQPLSLETGTILASDDDGNLIGRSTLDDGEVGITATYIINADPTSKNEELAIQDLIAERVDANKIKINWNVNKDILEYDHFILIKEANKKRKFLGAVISQDVIDFIEKDDAGTIIYYVIPVLNDYSLAPSSRSNSIIINPEEL